MDNVTDFVNSLNCFTGNCSIMSKKQMRLLDGGSNVFLLLVPGSEDVTGFVDGGSGCDWLWASMTRGKIVLVLVGPDRAALFQGHRVQTHTV